MRSVGVFAIGAVAGIVFSVPSLSRLSATADRQVWNLVLGEGGGDEDGGAPMDAL